MTKVYKIKKEIDSKGRTSITIVARGYNGCKRMGLMKFIAGKGFFPYAKRPVMMYRALKIMLLRKPKEDRQAVYHQISSYRLEHDRLDKDAKKLSVKFPQEVDMPPKRKTPNRFCTDNSFYVSFIPTKKRLTLREKKKRRKQAIDNLLKLL